ncbi:MAG: TlpA disulfide reductase family protein [Sphaerochaetaceae bacterium]
MGNTKTRKFVIVTITLFLIVTTLLIAKDQGKLAPFWTIDINRQEVDESIFTPYRLTLVNIWATFCPPCLQEMPALGELRREFADQGFNIVGIVTDVFDRNERKFQANLNLANLIVERTKADYRHLLISEDLHNLRLKDSQVVPESFFVDRQGNIVGGTYYGAKSKAAWKKTIESTLKLVK